MKLDIFKVNSRGRRLILRVFESSALSILDRLDEFDESALSEIPQDTRLHFEKGLEYRGFIQSSDKDDVKEFKAVPGKSKFSKSSDIRVYISQKEIWYSAPNARSYSSNLIFESFLSASEMAGDRPLLVYDTQNCEWLDYRTEPNFVVRTEDKYANMVSSEEYNRSNS